MHSAAVFPLEVVAPACTPLAVLALDPDNARVKEFVPLLEEKIALGEWQHACAAGTTCVYMQPRQLAQLRGLVDEATESDDGGEDEDAQLGEDAEQTDQHDDYEYCGEEDDEDTSSSSCSSSDSNHDNDEHGGDEEEAGPAGSAAQHAQHNTDSEAVVMYGEGGPAQTIPAHHGSSSSTGGRRKWGEGLVSMVFCVR
jgi:hypothetical protein